MKKKSKIRARLQRCCDTLDRKQRLFVVIGMLCIIIGLFIISASQATRRHYERIEEEKIRQEQLHENMNLLFPDTDTEVFPDDNIIQYEDEYQ